MAGSVKRSVKSNDILVATRGDKIVGYKTLKKDIKSHDRFVQKIVLTRSKKPSMKKVLDDTMKLFHKDDRINWYK